MPHTLIRGPLVLTYKAACPKVCMWQHRVETEPRTIPPTVLRPHPRVSGNQSLDTAITLHTAKPSQHLQECQPQEGNPTQW